MKIAAQVATGALARIFARVQAEIEKAARQAAADALAHEREPARDPETLHTPLIRRSETHRLWAVTHAAARVPSRRKR